MMGGGMGVGFGWMWLFWLLIVVGIGLLVVVVTRVIGGGVRGGAGTPTGGRGRARELLDERYARGELSTEEYRERLRILGEDT